MKPFLYFLLIALQLSNQLVWGEETSHLGIDHFKQLSENHPGKNGIYILEQGEEALNIRAWLADNAKHSIEVQYFIWSTDNVGTLATEALLRAANRGVHIRVIVDDLLIKAPDKTLLALAKHPNAEIKIYNPKHSVGTPQYKRILNLLADFRGFNQRMHDKTFIVDNLVLITGGRNMADEYFNYDSKYNFRDREVMVIGSATPMARQSFERFWAHPLSVSVEHLYDGFGILKKHVTVNTQEIQGIYQSMHDYATQNKNFPDDIRKSIQNLSLDLPKFTDSLIWTHAEFISDFPGKNNNVFSLGGSGRITKKITDLLMSAKKQIIIQSPYLVPTKKTIALFKNLIDRGIKISINTNSLASTDNLHAFSGYRNQRKKLLKMGVEIFEYKNHPEIQKKLIHRFNDIKQHNPTFAIHAKTLIIDNQILYIGTFNLDPRSVNLNTEVGVVIRDQQLANQVAKNIKMDMSTANSWNAKTDNPDQFSPWYKRTRVRFLQMLPLKPLL